ncbi:MAG: lipopolysaccharide core heptose(I) kinase RfaP [Phycisphaerales bacterium]
MIYIHPDYSRLFKKFQNVDDFLCIKVDLVRDFKNRKTGRFVIDGHGFYIKKHFECGCGMILDELLHLRKPHIGAEHEKNVLNKLHAIGIDTMKVVAFGKEGKSLDKQRSFLVTEELTNVRSLEDICKKWPTDRPSATFKKSLINQVALIAQKLHSNGLNHRDFYLCHFLLDISGFAKENEIRQPKLFLIDLHRAQERSQTPYRWRVKDIGGLYFSAMDIGLKQRDIFRFMRKYSGKSLNQTLHEDRRFWKDVQNRATKMYKKESAKCAAREGKIKN